MDPKHPKLDQKSDFGHVHHVPKAPSEGEILQKTKDLSSVDSINQETHEGAYMENIQGILMEYMRNIEGRVGGWGARGGGGASGGRGADMFHCVFLDLWSQQKTSPLFSGGFHPHLVLLGHDGHVHVPTSSPISHVSGPIKINAKPCRII